MTVLQKNKGCNSYLEITGITGLFGFEEKMLLYNKMKSIPELEIRNMNDSESLLYRIDGLSTLAARCGRVSPGINELKAIIKDLAACIREIGEYMLEPDGLYLDLKTVLYDTREDVYRFLYIPSAAGSFAEHIKSFFEEIMTVFNHEDREGAVSLYEIYSGFLVDNYSPVLFLEMADRLEGVKGIAADSVMVNDYQKPAEGMYPYEGGAMDYKDDKETLPSIPVRKYILVAAAVILIGIILLGIFGGVSLLITGAGIIAVVVYIFSDLQRRHEEYEIESDMKPYLMEYRENELEKREDELEKREPRRVSSLVPVESGGDTIAFGTSTSLRIGRQAENCECCISEPGISRVHARLTRDDGRVLLSDEGSTNGTYVNNERVTKGTRELKYGDIVSFAGVEYYCV